MIETKKERKRWTKSEAIAEHRKMWHWIANNLEKTKQTAQNLSPSEVIRQLKQQYCNMHDLDCIHNCICCDYDCQINGFASLYRCSNCPIVWGTENYAEKFYCEAEREERNGLYHIIKETYDISTQVKLAHQIAELYESPNSYDDILE